MTPRRQPRSTLRSSLLLQLASACALVGCHVDDYGNAAYRRAGACATREYRDFCETSAAPGYDAGTDAAALVTDARTADADADADAGDQPSMPSREGEPCAPEHDETLCYDAPERTRAVGACISGVAQCLDGRWTACFGQVMPTPEACNMRDDDCDGRTDESVDGDCVAPGNGCAGQVMCQSGHLVCNAIAEPMPETCNAIDDDCDGRIDEDSDRPCVEDNAGCVANGDGEIACKGACAPGIRHCQAGVLDKKCREQQKPAEAEHCDGDQPGVDDNCDGEADEGCPCKGSVSRACYAVSAQARDTGACMPGRQTCAGGKWGTCAGAGKPGAEACPEDGIDNDCNGLVDDIRNRSKHCASSRVGSCHDGTQQCVDDELRCVTPSPVSELCNGIDDDCDGKTDEPFDLKSDHDHCGDCDTACGAEETCCGGTCVDTRTDENNCGTCNFGCGPGGQCCDSFCGFINEHDNCGTCGHVCGVDEMCCSGECFDPQRSALHCGGCTIMCEKECVAGECTTM